MLLEHIRDEPKDFWQSTDQQETMHLQKVKGYSKRLEDHDFLWKFFYWLDVLDVESYVIKLNSGSNVAIDISQDACEASRVRPEADAP